MTSDVQKSGVDIHLDRLGWQPDTTPATMTTARTLAAALADRARREPSAVAYYLPDEPGGEVRLTVADLARLASAAGVALASAGLGRGDRVCLCLDTSPELLAALYGTALVGATAMLAEPPLTPSRRRVWLDRLRRIVDVAQPTTLVCAPELRESAEAEFGPLGVVVTCPPFGDGTLGRPVLDADPQEPIVIQFTSGTTSAAKGIVLSHRAVLAAVAAIGMAVPYQRGDLTVCWLPLHHDMGLVGSTLSPFLHDVPAVLIRPLSFGMRPASWLRLLHQYRGTVSAAPNFAYQLITSRVQKVDLAGLDLRHWRVALNGAEVVAASTVLDFQQAMGRYGFAPEALRPCYGMAEVGLAITFAPPDRRARIDRLSRTALADRGRAEPALSELDAQDLVSCGRPVPGTRVRVVDEHGQTLPEGAAGTILTASESMMTGYLGLSGHRADALRDGWLNTGDLGFFLDGELFVTGRAKDVIIIAGRNYHPQPFELAATMVDGVRPNGAAAVGLPDADTGTERLTVVVETKFYHDAEPAAQVRRAVERMVASHTGVPPSRVVTVRPGSLPRTSSGKTQRHLVAGMLARGQLDGPSPAAQTG
jgi:fatty-acyl-CoA synthase